ncbi:zinc-binding dehydrogenase [Streptomyces canus]|uniref:zinc-binding dehydrogenase n=1 Tax=Streptomyces canus TaxID=58343 RepID=UPI0036B9CC34
MATTASATKTDLEKNLGADVVIDYQKQAYESALHDCDVVVDTVGGETLDKSLWVQKPDGTVISITGPATRPPPSPAHRWTQARRTRLGARRGRRPGPDTLARNPLVSHGSRSRRQHRRSGCDHRLT